MTARVNRRPGRALVAVAGITVLAVSACSSSKSDSGSGGGGKTIVIGAPFPLTGIWALNGQNNVNGMNIAVNEINAAGGIKALGGAKLKVVSLDTSSDNPAQAQTVTTKLIDSNKAVALVGSYLSSLSLTATTAAEKLRVPMVTQSFVSTLTTRGYKYTFQIAPKASTFGTTTVNDIKEVFPKIGQPLRRIAIVTANDAAGQQQNSSSVAAAGAAGLPISANVVYPVGLTDAQAIVTKVAAAKPDAILMEGSLADITLIIKGVRSAGIKAPFVNPGGGGALTAQFTQTLGPLADGVYSASAWSADLKLPGVAQANNDYKAAYKVFMPQEAGESWAAVQVLAAAMEQAKSSNPDKIRDALASMDFTDGPASGMPPGKVGFDANGAPKYATPVLVQWQGGELKTVYPPELASATAIASK